MDIILFTILALIGAMPIILIVAAVKASTVNEARSETLTFLHDWGGIAPDGLVQWCKTTFGSSVAFFLLIALAFFFNLIGDGTAPRISAQFSHFEFSSTKWSVENAHDWSKLKTHLRENWIQKYPDQDLENMDNWNAWKNEHKKYQLRGVRTLIYFALLLAAAGIIDIIRRKYWRRGIIITLAGILFFISTTFIWSERTNHYIGSIISANHSLGDYKMPLPPSLKAIY